jgi:hypothetical protein
MLDRADEANALVRVHRYHAHHSFGTTLDAVIVGADCGDVNDELRAAS